MRWRRIVIVLVLLTAAADCADAGIFFNRRPRSSSSNTATPANNVDVLIQTLRGDASERRRAEAAENLRYFDTTNYPQVLQALIQSATSDTSSSVRIEAIQTLSKLRPVNEQAGWALEQAMNDSNLRVQWQARAALLQYRMSGYRQGSGVPPGERPVRTEEPPLAPPVTNAAPPVSMHRNQRIITPVQPTPYYPPNQQVDENVIRESYPPKKATARPMLQPAQPPRFQKPPTTATPPAPAPVVNEGPALVMPK